MLFVSPKLQDGADSMSPGRALLRALNETHRAAPMGRELGPDRFSKVAVLTLPALPQIVLIFLRVIVTIKTI